MCTRCSVRHDAHVTRNPASLMFSFILCVCDMCMFSCDEDSHSVGESGNRVRSHSHPLPKFTLTPDTEQNELHRLRTSISGGPPKQSTADFADDLSDEDDESQIGKQFEHRLEFLQRLTVYYNDSYTAIQ